MKVEVRFKRVFQVKPYETETIEFAVWEDINLNDGFENRVTTSKVLQPHMEKALVLKGEMFQMMAEKADEVMSERLNQMDPRDAADPVRR